MPIVEVVVAHFLATRAHGCDETGDELASYLTVMERVAREYGLDVEYEAGPSMGNYACGAIIIDAALPADARLATLVHLLAHALDWYGDSPADREVIAETVAAIVSNWLGLAAGFVLSIAHELRKTAETGIGRYAPAIERVARNIEVELATLGVWDS